MNKPHALSPEVASERLGQQLLWLVAIVAGVFCFWNLGHQGLRLWDETRYAENARQMLLRGNYLDYFYFDSPDDWVAKPPLGIWAIALAFKCFGLSEWALRLPSALFALAAIALAVATVRLYRGPLTAAVVGMILVTCRGIIGPHVSRSGDLDAAFVATAMLMIYGLARYGERRGPGALLVAGLGAGLCFFSKGVMMALLLPGILLFVVAGGHWRHLWRQWATYAAVAILMAFIGGWYATVKLYGQKFPTSAYGGDAWDTMIQYDILRRYTEKLEGDNTTPLFTFMALDVRFGPWIYLLYIGATAYVISMRRHLDAAWRAWRQDGLVLLATCIAVPTALFLTTSQTKFNWYYAITTPFFAMLTAAVTMHGIRRWRWLRPVAGLIAAAALAMQAYFLLRQDHSLTDQIVAHDRLLRDAAHVYVSKMPTDAVREAVAWRQHSLELVPKGVSFTHLEPISANIARIEAEGAVRGAGPYSVLLSPSPSD